MSELIAFHGDPKMKAAIMASLAAHREADEIVQGKYWENGKGCAVGCTLDAVKQFEGKRAIEHGKHALYERYLGVPQILARLEDRIFEGLSNGAAKAWPERFTGAIRPGADLTMIWPRLALWLLTEELPQHAKSPEAASSLAAVGALYREWSDGTKPHDDRWYAAAHAAWAASDAATSIWPSRA